jgi:hypothetical protein
MGRMNGGGALGSGVDEKAPDSGVVLPMAGVERVVLLEAAG